jgi:hypothetical protein
MVPPESDGEVPTLKTVLAAFRADPGGLTEVACNVLFVTPLSDTESRIVFETDGSSDYYLMAAAYQEVPMGRLRLNISAATPPGNDAIAGAAPVSLSDAFPLVQPVHSAIRQQTDPVLSCAPLHGHSVWFHVQEPGAQPLTLDTVGSNYDTVAAVFRRNQDGTLTELACNNNSLGIITASVSWQSDGGEYFVIVAASGFSAGSVLRADLLAQ